MSGFLTLVMAGLDPAIHAFLCAKQDVDGRVSPFGRPGHDDQRASGIDL